MTDVNGFDEFERALERLDALRVSVARQSDAEDVFDAMQALQLAVARTYGGRRPRAASGRGARRRILEHFQQHVTEWITGEELAAVSGIGEWARRVRELRLELGYRIDEQDGSYRLLAADPDLAAAHRWQALSAIRRSGGTPKDRVRALLSDPLGDVVSSAELSYVAGGRDAAVLVAELRDEDGLPIDSAMDSRDLHGGEFRLLSMAEADHRDEHQRLFFEATRAAVFQRDNYTCWGCRRDRDAAAASGEAVFYLQVHHMNTEADDLEHLPIAELTDQASLATYCQRCLVEQRAAVRLRRRRQVSDEAPPEL